MSYILYEGPSLLRRGERVVTILTCVDHPSKNADTGDMAQTFILNADIPPLEALKSKKIGAICGDCKHINNTCYVNVAQSVTQIYKTYKRDRYSLYKGENLAKPVRIGAYGDPAAIPLGVWKNLLCHAPAWTGYTHFWRLSRVQSYRKILMASIDTPSEYSEARALGWRPFRVREPGTNLLATEFQCPKKRLTCLDCLACCGNKIHFGAHTPSIEVHGVPHKIQKFISLKQV